MVRESNRQIHDHQVRGHVSFQRCGHLGRSGELDYENLEALHRPEPIDGIRLDRDWGNRGNGRRQHLELVIRRWHWGYERRLSLPIARAIRAERHPSSRIWLHRWNGPAHRGFHQASCRPASQVLLVGELCEGEQATFAARHAANIMGSLYTSPAQVARAAVLDKRA